MPTPPIQGLQQGSERASLHIKFLQSSIPRLSSFLRLLPVASLALPNPLPWQPRRGRLVA
ncbi:hypothetical protein ARTHROSP310_39090 [Arthrobacter sp. AD-310]